MDPKSILPVIGPDGLVEDNPVIKAAEKAIQEKEANLRRYIDDNYSKIRTVEKELAGLALQAKLTSGPKKAALEYLRRKIEQATEKIRIAKERETAAKKVWEAMKKLVMEEEAAKEQLCKDLSDLVQQSAMEQFDRLEELKKKLDALNPTMPAAPPANGPAPPVHSNGGGHAVSGSSSVFPAGQAIVEGRSEGGEAGPGSTGASAPAADSSSAVAAPPRQAAAAEDAGAPGTGGSKPSLGSGAGRGGTGLGKARNSSGGRGRGRMVLGARKNGTDAWTGAGFDVEVE